MSVLLPRVACALVPAAAFVSTPAAAQTRAAVVDGLQPGRAAHGDQAHPTGPRGDLRRHHVGLQLGLFNPSTDAIGLGNMGLVLDRSDGQTIVRYRYSVNPRVDLVAELRYWVGRGLTARSEAAKVSGGFLGPGLRIRPWNGQRRRAVPYLQGNLYYASEMLGEPEIRVAHGIGFGLGGGVDIMVTRRISIPVEAAYVASSGVVDDLSGVGVSAGVSVSF